MTMRSLSVGTVPSAVHTPVLVRQCCHVAPALQLPALVHWLSLAPPFQVSAVSGGGAFCVALRAAAMRAMGCALGSDCFESLRFDPLAASAEARGLRLQRAVSRQRTVIHRVTTREDAGRMGYSIRNRIQLAHSQTLIFVNCVVVTACCYSIPQNSKSRKKSVRTTDGLVERADAS